MIKTAIDFDHNFSMRWESEEDMVLFLKEFVVPNAKTYGIKVTWEKENETQASASAQTQASMASMNSSEPITIRA
jgi:hypothetical protein